MSKNRADWSGQAQVFKKDIGQSDGSRTLGEPLILAVETSGRLGSVAIAIGRQLLAKTDFSRAMRHSAEVFPSVRSLLEQFGRKPKEIEHIYISVGPGSFTGLRIAVTMAKAMQLANGTKIVAVDTLDVIAANVIGPEKIATILDAKRGQFFVSVYQNKRGNGQWKKILADCLMTASQFVEQFAGKAEPVWLLGEGLVYYKDAFKADGIKFLDETYWYPKAENVYQLGLRKALQGEFSDALRLQPVYLRRPDVKIKK